jgi:hypothetical protein
MELVHIVGLTLDMVGTVLIAYTALRVHHRVRKEHRIDEQVFSEMRLEMILGVLGVCLIISGYLLQVVSISAI